MSACGQELFPGTFQPTPAHFFMKLLHDKGLLLRSFTQNIDSLENQAGLPKQDIVAAHGNFDSKLQSLPVIVAILYMHSISGDHDDLVPCLLVIQSTDACVTTS